MGGANGVWGLDPRILGHLTTRAMVESPLPSVPIAESHGGYAHVLPGSRRVFDSGFRPAEELDLIGPHGLTA